MPDSYVVSLDSHRHLVTAAFQDRGFTADEADAAARFCELAAWHGIKTHNALKALHLDDHFGSGNKQRQGCVPGATLEKLPTKFKASEKWNANRKLGQATAFAAMDRCIELADEYGIGQVSVDNAFHYLWGGGYVMDAAKKGYIAYTNCTAALAEVVPFMGKFPTLGTNPHSWAFPTTDAIGYPLVIDWATSTVAMGRVQQFKREGKQLPPQAAVDKDGNPTTDPAQVAALLPFGAHKGYGLSLINEVVAAFIGGSLPTLRSRPEQAGEGEKTTPNFYFQVIHPDALNCGAFARGRDQVQNVKAVIQDILGHGNSPPEGNCLLPGQIEHDAAVASAQANGLIFSEAEVTEFRKLADALGVEFDAAATTTA
ncbi:MAG: Ldh family oxidoreductase [Phycisphaeraceae bacterium]